VEEAKDMAPEEEVLEEEGDSLEEEEDLEEGCSLVDYDDEEEEECSDGEAVERAMVSACKANRISSCTTQTDGSLGTQSKKRRA